MAYCETQPLQGKSFEIGNNGKCQKSNVNLYSTLSIKTSNALDTLIQQEQECLQRLSKNVSWTLRITKVRRGDFLSRLGRSEDCCKCSVSLQRIYAADSWQELPAGGAVGTKIRPTDGRGTCVHVLHWSVCTQSKHVVMIRFID